MPEYLRQVRNELKHVSWPSREDTIIFTTVVILVSLAVAVYLGILDYIFEFLIKKII